MRRFIVGLLATIGTVTVIAIAGAVIFVTTGPLAPKALPDTMVLSLDLRRVPSERGSGGVLSGLWRDRQDLVDTVQLLWQAADHPRRAGPRRSARGRGLCRDRRRRRRPRPRPGAAPGDRPLPRQGQVRGRLRRG